MQSLRVTTQPTVEPVTLTQAKSHCRLETSSDDALMSALVTAARAWCEEHCARKFVTQTVDLTLDAFPCGSLCLPGGVVQSITHVKYRDEDDALQTWAAAEYISDLNSEPARLEPAMNYAYPAARGRVGAVTVRYVAGYAPIGSPTDYAEPVPQPIKQAILMMVGHFYENRESVAVGVSVAEMPMGVDALLWPYRIL